MKKSKPFFGDSLNLPEVEERVLKFWEENQIFEKSLKQRQGKKKFVFYEGPPGPNGRPGIHHVLPRVFKDIVLRFRTMQGFYVPRKSGWDTHGLPIEIAAEKELKLSSKKDIEAYGIAAFNKKCRELVWKYKNEWERYTKRIGFWVDLERPYVTYESSYIESLWWIIKKIADKKLLQKGHKVVPWCTRCGTALSAHELGQPGVYKEVTEPSVYVKFKLHPGQHFGPQKKYKTGNTAYIIAWTTTPWTLPGNIALAIGEKINYTALRVKGIGELYIVASDLVQTVFKDQAIEIVHDDIKGKDLMSLSYEPLFNVAPLQTEASYKVYAADFVTTSDGSGVVHTAAMYGEDDYALGKAVGLPQHHTVDESGKFTADVKELEGQYVKDKETDKKIFAYLQDHGYLLRVENYTHEYPHCWRCSTPLLYYAHTSWFVLTSRVNTAALANNNRVNWIPSHIKNGRFGEWLQEKKDWNFSRERYWGTPLPVWECESCGTHEVIGSLEELSKKAVKRNTFLFARHGESDNVVKSFLSYQDLPNRTSKLTKKGESQVKKLALLFKHEKVDVIVSSPLQRMRQTAEAVSAVVGIPVEYYNELADVNSGSYQGKSLKEARSLFKDWLEHFTKPYPEGESLDDVKRRLWQFVKKIDEKYEGKTIAIFTHGDPLLMIKGALEGKTNEEILKMPYPKVGALYKVDFKGLPLDDDGNLDLHRPYVDEVQLRCGKCAGVTRRIKEVADVWYDSGSMPFAQWHYPFENRASIDKKQYFPADFITEGIDQTRGWFYTLLQVSTLLGYEPPYRNVISLGLVNDKFGQKMSKSKGNVVDPWMIMDKYGIDAVRWYFYTLNDPGDSKNFDEAEILKSFRRMHLILFNSLGFLLLYGPKTVNLALAKKIKPAGYGILDSWILARLAQVQEEATEHLENYHIREAALAIEGLVDDLSRWYIRRSRRRLQKSEDKNDYAQVSAVLAHVLLETTKLIAPFTPFFAEAMYQSLAQKVSGTKQSVHLADWSESKTRKDAALLKGMHQVRQIASAGLALRASAGIKVRQPLGSLTTRSNLPAIYRKQLEEILKDEVNVKAVKVSSKQKEEALLDTNITPELAREGLFRELVRMVQELRQKANLHPADRIAVYLDAPEEVRMAVVMQEADFKKDVGAKSLDYNRTEKFDAEIVAKLAEYPVWLALKK